MDNKKRAIRQGKTILLKSKYSNQRTARLFRFHGTTAEDSVLVVGKLAEGSILVVGRLAEGSMLVVEERAEDRAEGWAQWVLLPFF